MEERDQSSQNRQHSLDDLLEGTNVRDKSSSSSSSAPPPPSRGRTFVQRLHDNNEKTIVIAVNMCRNRQGARPDRGPVFVPPDRRIFPKPSAVLFGATTEFRRSQEENCRSAERLPG